MEKKPTPRAVALLPVAVFLALYLVLGIILEYVLKIEMGFYQIPIVVAFLVALLVACLQNRRVSFEEKLVLMGQGIGDKNIVTMILIFFGGRYLCGGHRAFQRRGRGLFSAVHCSGKAGGGCAVCGGLLCIHGHGNLGGHHHAFGPHCGGCVGQFRL